MDEFIAHHGILGQRWGIRRYQNKDGSLTAAGRKHWDQLDRKTKAKIKDNMIRSSNVKVLQAHQKYLTPNELRKATERLAANKRVSAFKEEEIQRGMQRIAELGNRALVVGNTVNNITQSYNKIAKVINSVSGKDLPIIGEAKAARKFSYEELKNIDISKLKGQELENAMKAINYHNVTVSKLDQANAYYKIKAEEKAQAKAAKAEEKAQAKAAKAEAKVQAEAAKAEANNKRSEMEKDFRANYSAMLKNQEISKSIYNTQGEMAKKDAVAYANAAGRKDDISVPKKESEKMLPAVITPPPVIKTEASKPISAFKEHYTSDDINSARNYVMSNFGNVSYNNVGNYKYSNPSFSEQYRKKTERNNNRNPYYVSHADMSYDALIASFAN
jgi:hypothetical protein